MMKNILLCGALGRMGQEIIREAAQFDFIVREGIDIKNQDFQNVHVCNDFSQLKEKADVLIDFSRPELLKDILSYAKAHALPCVLASTGYQEADEILIQEYANYIPIFKSANMSTGIFVLKMLAKKAKQLLPEFDIEIVETHHKHKADAPSGTALMLLDAIKEDDNTEVFGRPLGKCPRKDKEIGVHAIRGGSVPGKHELQFLGEQEVITLSHDAQSRTIFALGALRAASFLLNKENGLYQMDDMMNGLL